MDLNGHDIIMEMISKILSPKKHLNRRMRRAELLGKLIYWQEELDWECHIISIISNKESLLYNGSQSPQIRLGERAFEIALARKMAAGEVQTTWFERHGSTPSLSFPPTGLPTTAPLLSGG